MKIIGRKREIDQLDQCLTSGRPEFVVVYGRRRVGKTYLIKQFFRERFSFYATGLTDEKMKGQLRAFHESLRQYGDSESNAPSDWFEAFTRLRKVLTLDTVYKDPITNRRIVFLDELPWMDTQRSDFKSALDYFWNSWGSSQEDLLLIVCGSATSWIIGNLLKGRKGFHNRVTRRIQLLPFTLKESEELLTDNGFLMPKIQIIECYMVFGGIPYYLNLMNPRFSLAQNIEELCFKEYGELRDEYGELFCSLFGKPARHLAIIHALSSGRRGMTRSELANIHDIGSGAGLTNNLDELEQCGFIRKYSNYATAKNGAFYQLTDPFTLFAEQYLTGDSKRGSWMEYINMPGYLAWRGNAFEIICLNHIPQMKAALGIQGVTTQEYSWRSISTEPGAQIDLIIDRKDGVINLCEMKFTEKEYAIPREEYERLLHRLTAFRNEMAPDKAIHITLVAPKGIKKNKYSGVALNVITEEDLFRM